MVQAFTPSNSAPEPTRLATLQLRLYQSRHSGSGGCDRVGGAGMICLWFRINFVDVPPPRAVTQVSYLVPANCLTQLSFQDIQEMGFNFVTITITSFSHILGIVNIGLQVHYFLQCLQQS